MMAAPRTWFLALLVPAFVVLGCGGPRPLPVQGRVNLAGGGDVARLAGYVVSFEPDATTSESAAASCTGEVQRDGSFKLTTLAPDDGAIAGSYRVILTPPPPPLDAPIPKPLVDAKYFRLDTTDLRAEVAPDKLQVTLELVPAQ